MRPCGLFFSGLKQNETVPKPVLPEPRVPSKKEKEEAVQLLILFTNGVSKKSFRHILTFC